MVPKKIIEGYNKVHFAGALELFKKLRSNSTLKMIELAGNPLKHPAVYAALKDALLNNCLQSLIIPFCDLSDEVRSPNARFIRVSVQHEGIWVYTLSL